MSDNKKTPDVHWKELENVIIEIAGYYYAQVLDSAAKKVIPVNSIDWLASSLKDNLVQWLTGIYLKSWDVLQEL